MDQYIKGDIQWGEYKNNILTIPANTANDIINCDELSNVLNIFDSAVIISADIRKVTLGGYIPEFYNHPKTISLFLFFGDYYEGHVNLVSNSEIVNIQVNSLYLFNTSKHISFHSFINGVYYLEIKLGSSKETYDIINSILDTF
jgi:hypothetical protein